jgi:hypothetical protein
MEEMLIECQPVNGQRTLIWSRAKRITIHLEPRDDGGLRVCSDDLPGLVLSNADADAVLNDLGPAVKGIWKNGGE